MIVLADTGPVNYLVLIGAIDVLRSLYGRIIIAQAVARELQHNRAPNIVRDWILQPPTWIDVYPDPPLDVALDFLDPGEQGALKLAELLQADQFIVDDRAGRLEAERRGISVTGTLGVLAAAHLAGLSHFDEALAKLRATMFRLHPKVEEEVRRQILRHGNASNTESSR